MSEYLGSTKNLAGCVGGLVGVGLHFSGLVTGVLWVPVVVVLYAAGALVGPPERVRLTVDPTAEAAALRSDLDALLAKVTAAQSRLPEGTLAQLDRIADYLRPALDRPAELAGDPETGHSLIRLIRTDIPLAVEGYLNLPWWMSVGKKGPAEELGTQLGLLEADAKAVSTAFFADDVRRQADHTRYLEDRAGDEEG
nr:hypothetical protein [Actinokineospora inagensis]